MLQSFQIQKLLENGGASNSKFMLSSITHVICGRNFDESVIGEAIDLYAVPSVTEEWVIASAQLSCLASTKPYDPLPNQLFSAITVAISQVSAEDRKRLYAMITFNGGRVERALNAKTTHLVCGLAGGPHYAKALEIKNDSIVVVTPDWIQDCLKNRELLDVQIYHPRLIVGAPRNVKVAPVPTMTANIQTKKPTLSSILGMDIDDKPNKPDLTKSMENKATNEMQMPANAITAMVSEAQVANVTMAMTPSANQTVQTNVQAASLLQIQQQANIQQASQLQTVNATGASTKPSKY